MIYNTMSLPILLTTHVSTLRASSATLCLFFLRTVLVSAILSTAIGHANSTLSVSVVDIVSNTPVHAATVSLAKTDHGLFQCSTNTEGQCLLTDLAPGVYRLRVYSSGYMDMPSRYGGAHHVIVEPSDSDSLTVGLTPVGVISGRVLDSNGRPVQMARVLPVIRQVRDGGHDMLSLGEHTRTDDRGEYRLYGLPPATYSIVVCPNPNSQAVLGARIFAPIFYPGSGSAEFFDLAGGEERISTDVSLIQHPTVSLSGTVSAIPRESNIPRVAVTVVSSDGLHIPLSTQWTEADGTFSIDTISVGSYTVFASLILPQHTRLAQREPRTFWARQSVTLIGTSTEIHLTLQPTLEVQGLLTIDGRPGSRAPCRGTSTLLLRPLDGWPDAFTAAPSENDGHFALDGLPSGRFRIEMPDLERHCRISSVVAGNTSFPATEVLLNSSTTITINVISAVGEVTGRVSNWTERPRTTGVVLLSTDDPTRTDFAHISHSGQYRFTDLPSGHYVVAIVDASRLSTSHHTNAAQYRAASPVSVTAGSTVTVNFQLE